MSFSQFNLHPNINKALQACGYANPTPIQSRCIPEVLNKKDVLASAQTGTGKTAAFVLPALHCLSNKKAGNKPRVLILTPTRELANQITDASNKYSRFMQCHIVNLVGGMSYRQQLKNLSRPVDMIVATPGRLLDHMQNKRLDFSQIEMLILDEADRMLDMGFIEDVQKITKAVPKTRQVLLFSATINAEITKIANQLLKDPVRIDLSHEKLAPADIKQTLYQVDSPEHKLRVLKHLLANQSIYKGIIFSRTKINADKLAQTLCDLGFSAAGLHGDLKQNARNRVVEQLRRGKIQYVVATDVAARGIDIQDVTHVINYDLPKFSEDYVHRIGRTGRAGKSGKAISFVLSNELHHLKKIERYINQTIHQDTIPGLEPKIKHHAAHKQEKGRHNKNKSFKNKSHHAKSHNDKPFSKHRKKFKNKKN